MENQIFIKAEDTALESSISTMYDKLKALDIELETSLKLNSITNVYVMHLYDKEHPMISAEGKGSCAKTSEASALGTYFERLSTNYFFTDFYLGEEIANSDFVHYPNEKWFEDEDGDMPSGLLDENLWSFYDPNEELEPEEIFDTNSGAIERGICALPFKRVRDEEEIYFPVNFIANLYSTHGMAAGSTEIEARLHALCEVFEHYVKNRVIIEGMSLPLIPKEIVDRSLRSKEMIEALENHGYTLRLCDASLGGLYPVVSVTLIDPQNGSFSASFGAHPCLEVALERTIISLLQGDDIDGKNTSCTPTFNMMEVRESKNLENHFMNSKALLSYDFFKSKSDYEFVDWSSDLSSTDAFEKMVGVIHESDLDIYIADYTHLGVDVCRILVPEMSEIYPLEDLSWNNNNEGAMLREAILNLNELDEDDAQELYEDLEDSTANNLQSVAEFIGVFPQKDSLWASLCVGELKAMLCLYLGDYERAQQWNNLSLNSDILSDERLRHHRCLGALLSIVLDEEKVYKDYASALTLLYGKETLDICINIVNGETNFHGLGSPGLSLDGFTSHQQMLARYKRLQEKMRKA